MNEHILALGGQNAFVTGVGLGAGRNIAKFLAQHGAGGVALTDHVFARAKAVAAEIEEMGFRAVAVEADVDTHESIAAGFDSANHILGPISILINNAGSAAPEVVTGNTPLFWDTYPDEWVKHFRSNLRTVMNCCHIALPTMVKLGRGRVVTIIPEAGRGGGPHLSSYAAATGGAGSFMRSLAREAACFGVTCNAISVSTRQTAADEADDANVMTGAHIDTLLSRHAVSRFGESDDVAALALFLASDAASRITGQIYPVNGSYGVAS